MTEDTKRPSPIPAAKIPAAPKAQTGDAAKEPAIPEIGGPSGPEPTRYGDWERGGRCSDF